MQTFLPYSDFKLCARVLDRQRLGKQRVECKQILLACMYQTKGWVNHPVVRMWRGYEVSLCQYAMAVCHEWTRRGYTDNLCMYFGNQLKNSNSSIIPMPFIGNEDMHLQYRRILYTKQPEYYERHFGKLEPLASITYERFII